MKETVLESIVAFFIGHKYYANIFNTRGTARCDISSFVFSSKRDADEHKREMEDNASYKFVERISFRSRNTYRLSTIQGYLGTIIL